jgi:hypothetical protein
VKGWCPPAAVEVVQVHTAPSGKGFELPMRPLPQLQLLQLYWERLLHPDHRHHCLLCLWG